jgi:hypothetical protein
MILVSLTVLVLLLLSTGHLMCFPLLTVSTFEAKPRGTYFEENALLPGASSASFNLSLDDASPSAVAVSCAEVERRGFPCHQAGGLVWTYASPLFTDDCKELIVLVALAPPGASFHGAFLSLLRHVRTGKYLSKTVALLFCSNTVDVARWLKMYREAQAVKNRRTNFSLAGAIRASLLIELPNQTSSHKVVLKISGDNGRLPNQDLPNLIAHAFRGRVELEDARPSSNWISSLLGRSSFGEKFTSIVNFVEATGRNSTGSHGAFLRYLPLKCECSFLIMSL